MNCKRPFVAALFLLVPWSVFAQDSQNVEYAIGPRDVVEIKVAEIPDLNVERRVSDNGTIDLPLVGAVNIEGLTTAAASEKLSALLISKYVNRATVSMMVKEYGNKPFTVVGAVARPGPLNLNGRYSLVQVLSAAGGLTANAGRKIYIVRTADNGLSDVLEVKTDDLFRTSNAYWNVPLYPADIINVPARTTIKVFCLGEVKNPGAIEFDSDDRVTLLTVLAKAGGFTGRASKEVRIKRRGPDGKDIEINVNYNGVIAGTVPDPVINPDDVIIVKQSFF